MKLSIFSTASLLATAALAGSAWEEHHGFTLSTFKAAFEKLTKAGYRPTYITGDAESNGDPRYNGIFKKSTLLDDVAWTAQYGYPSEKFSATIKDLQQNGYHPTRVQGFNIGRDPTGGHHRRFNGIWKKYIDGRRVDWELEIDATKDEMKEAFGKFPPRGYRLTGLSGYGIGSEQRFTAVFEKTPGPAWKATIGMEREEYQKRTQELQRQGFYPADLSVYNIGGTVYFSAIWNNEDGKSEKSIARFGMTAQEAADWFNQYKRQGYEPVALSGYLEHDALRYAAVISKL
ncbi:hypothetical protein TMEN_8114 [Trichophyton mentagrophytes]|nr:hypothetical protein TMEN_8114 [Trichophyton mentagrophytes]